MLFSLQHPALLLGLFLFTIPPMLSAQTLADRLGYPPGTKVVIIHADDLGETHAVNAAAMKALESGAINSASMMVPCPWFPEIADYAKSHPDADFGLHLTLTSERVYYRWGPSSSPRIKFQASSIPTDISFTIGKTRSR